MSEEIMVHIYPVSLAIREYLLKKGNASAGEFYHMYKPFKATTSMQSTYHTFYVLKKLNLIAVDHTAQEKGRIAKSYYRIVPENINSENWNDPQHALYPKNL